MSNIYHRIYKCDDKKVRVIIIRENSINNYQRDQFLDKNKYKSEDYAYSVLAKLYQKYKDENLEECIDKEEEYQIFKLLIKSNKKFNTIQDIIEAGEIYYRIYKERQDKLCVVTMQDFDEDDYRQINFLSKKRYKIESDAFLELINIYNDYKETEYNQFFDITDIINEYNNI
jgi:hypothetical protein